MDDDDLGYLPATRCRQLLDAGSLSARELIEAVVRRIEALEPQLNAFAATTFDQAVDAAEKADQARARGEGSGLLHGLPVTIKDLQSTRGILTQRGSITERGKVGEFDAPFVERLKQNGAIPLGKTTTSEFGWKGVSQSPLTGITHNPWGHGLNAGASSAGAGVGAAAGYGALHQGSDGAGSIRMPAHFCGVYGLKPSFGRIPNWPISNNDQTSHLGPMTRTVADAALMLEALAGPDHRDHYSLEAQHLRYSELTDADVKGLRIAYSPDLGHARVDPEVAELVQAGAHTLEGLGAIVEEITPSWGPQGPELARFFWSAHELNHLHLLDTHSADMDPGLVACIRSALDLTLDQYLRMRHAKLQYVAAIHTWFQDFDLLLTPAVSVAAFPADQLQPKHWPQHEWDWLMWAEFSYPFNMSHNPAASIPCGFTPAGMPVGLQLVGQRLDEPTVLRASRAMELAKPWADKRPPLELAV
jgi:aspartyl-tRNA(Asn)/glutamyl-tRNA(Gln) amidotransferase subunit A